jgi:hypothetical protein
LPAEFHTKLCSKVPRKKAGVFQIYRWIISRIITFRTIDLLAHDRELSCELQCVLLQHT